MAYSFGMKLQQRVPTPIASSNDLPATTTSYFLSFKKSKSVVQFERLVKRRAIGSGLPRRVVLGVGVAFSSQLMNMAGNLGSITFLASARRNDVIDEVLTEYIVQDLNVNPKLSFEDNTFDIITNVVSVDYLTKPLEVFKEMRRILKPGGLAFQTVVFGQKQSQYGHQLEMQIMQSLLVLTSIMLEGLNLHSFHWLNAGKLEVRETCVLLGGYICSQDNFFLQICRKMYQIWNHLLAQVLLVSSIYMVYRQWIYLQTPGVRILCFIFKKAGYSLKNQLIVLL